MQGNSVQRGIVPSRASEYYHDLQLNNKNVPGLILIAKNSGPGKNNVPAAYTIKGVVLVYERNFVLMTLMGITHFKGEVWCELV